MGFKNLGSGDPLIDVESRSKEKIKEKGQGTNSACGGDKIAGVLNNVYSGFIGISDLFNKGEEALCSENCVSISVEISPSILKDLGSVKNVVPIENKMSVDKMKKVCKKPPRPPRPPKSSSFNMADLKLMRELSELAELKRARIERMKKIIKNPKSASSNSRISLFALAITVLFCLVIVCQGVFSHGNSSI